MNTLRPRIGFTLLELLVVIAVIAILAALLVSHTFMDEVALEQAKRAGYDLAAGKDRGPLHGVPWGLKDIIAYPGYPTTWCAPAVSPPPHQRESGGRRATGKCGGRPHRQARDQRIRGRRAYLLPRPDPDALEPTPGCGGFVLGSGSATAAGLVGFSIATDTAGSITNPVDSLRDRRLASNLPTRKPLRVHATVLVARYGRANLPLYKALCWPR